MAKQFNMTIRLKNITENTVAVAGTVVSPKASVPVKAKKASHINSILLNHQQGKIEVLNLEVSALAALIGFDLGEVEEVVENQVTESSEGDEKAPEGDEKTPEGDEKTPEGDDKAPEGDKKAPEGDEAFEPEGEDKKPAAPKTTTKKTTAKKPAVKKEETEQPNLLEENE